MSKVITNKEINLSQLDKELGGFGLCINANDAENKIITTSDKSLVTDQELQSAIATHIAIDENAINLAARTALLNRLGITAEEAALLLG